MYIKKQAITSIFLIGGLLATTLTLTASAVDISRQLVESLVAAQSFPVGGETRANLNLQKNATRQLFVQAIAKDTACNDHTVTGTQALPPTPPTTDNTSDWMEIWTVSSCGSTHEMPIAFLPQMPVDTLYAISNENNPDAIEKLKEAVQKTKATYASYSPKQLAEVALKNGKGNFILQNNQMAKKQAQYALSQLSPSDPESKKSIGLAYFLRGSVFLREKDFNKAERDLTDAVATLQGDPNQIEANFALGTVYFQQNQLAKAQPLITGSINKLESLVGKESPLLLNKYITLSSLLIKNQQFKEAKVTVDKASRLAEKTFGADSPQLNQVKAMYQAIPSQ